MSTRATAAVALLAAVLAASPALAQREPVIVPYPGGIPADLRLGPLTPTYCRVGNTNQPAYMVQDFLLPPEEYKLAFNMTVCAGCSGVSVNRIHILLRTYSACDISMAVRLERAIFPNSPSCPEPGPVYASTVEWAVQLGSAGTYDVSLPIGTHCLPAGDTGYYLLTVFLRDVDCVGGGMPALLTDRGASYCTNWNDFGTGWYDLLQQYPNWPGNLLIYADAECCSPPVPLRTGTWGAIKSLYR